MLKSQGDEQGWTMKERDAEYVVEEEEDVSKIPTEPIALAAYNGKSEAEQGVPPWPYGSREERRAYMAAYNEAKAKREQV